jgi:hypothetical protein
MVFASFRRCVSCRWKLDGCIPAKVDEINAISIRTSAGNAKPITPLGSNVPRVLRAATSMDAANNY